MAKVANLKSSIQSKIQKDVTSMQQKTASSTEATQAGSTITPEVTPTPKVTQTAKAMPSITRPDISQIATPTVSQTPSARDLFAPSTTPTLRKADTTNLLNTKTERKEITKTALPTSLVRSANTQGGAAKETVDKTLMEQFSDWFKETPEKVTNKVGDFFKGPVMSFGTSFERMINDTEYWVAGLADVIETSLGGEGGFKQAFQGQQGWYWDAYGEENDIKASKLYEQDTQAQNVSRDVSDYIWTVTGNKEMSNMIGNVVGNVTASLKDPEQIASVAGYMTPALIMQWATGGGFLANTAIWLPSQSTNVYKDFSEDKELSSQFTDNQLFGISTGLGTILSMVETFGDALGDMPWAKAMSRSIRNAFTKSLKKPIAEGLTKEITDVVDRNLIKDIKQPVLNALKKWYLGSIGEGLEEVTQDTLQTEGARALGSKREGMSLEQMLTTYFTAKGMGLFISGPGAALNIKNNSDLKKQYDEFSKTVDKVSPGINEDTKMAFFSVMITSQQNDANLSEKKVEEYEEQTTKLYEERSMFEQRLKQADNDEVRAKINGMIEQTDNKIKEIDKKINQWNNTRDEINKYIEERNAKAEEEETQKELEELHAEVNQSIEGENLSEQTMESIDTDKPTDTTEEKEKKPIKLPSTDYDYTSLASALNQPTNTYLQDLSDEDLQKLHDTTFDRWKALIDEEIYGGAMIDATRAIIRKVNEEVARREKESGEKATKKSEEEKTATKTKMKFKDAKDYVNKMIEIDKRNGVWSRSNDKFLRKAYMSDFLRNNLEGDFAAHLPGLKNVNLKQIKGKLTDKDIRDIAEMLSLVSTTLGIDFNKVIQDKDMSMNIVYDIKDFLYNTGALGLMSWKATKQMVKDLAERSGERFNANFGADLAKMGVALTLQEGPMKSAATMAHELMHLIDFALSTEEGLPLYFERGKVTYTSIIKDDSSWKTYTKGNYNKDYYNRWQEIIARYAEQYFAYKNDKDLFDKFTKRTWYWTEEEFMKLIPKFESFIKNRLGAKLLDEQNQFYNDIVRRINENKFSTISTEFDKEGLREDEVKYKLEQLKEEYVWIMEHIDEMTGTLKEEMETYVQLSNIQTNYEMAKAKGEEYLEKLKTTPEQQGTIDGVTTTVLPPEPEPGNPSPMPPQKPEIIRQGFPYYGGSNIEEGVGDIAEGGDGPQLGNSYTKEEDIIKIRKRKNKIKNFRKELGQAWKDIFTPTISRIYNISPRIAGRLITMETQKNINIHRYRQKAKGFVETLGKLKGKQALEVKMALLDYGALASEQGENIEQYKKEEVAKLKEVLLRNGFKEQDINDMFSVLDDIGQQYKDAGLSVTLTDMYFPRVVKDYEGLIDYMNRVSGKDIKVNKASLLLRIKKIQDDPKLSDEEKEKRIRHVISTEFKQPGATSQHGKERKIGKLSDWGEGIFAYYESPIESIDHYIVTMTNAIQRQLFLGGLKEDANTDADIINQDTTESVSQIIGKLVEDGMINEEDVEELQKSILAVLNKKPSPKSVTALKDITYIATITNFLSAINQLDDLGMVILKDRSGLKHIVKAIFGKANIKYDDLGLEDSYEMFREEGGITNWLFKKSLFNFFDRLGKTSFINAAWESMVRQSKNEKTREYLYTRLVSMYGQESADRMMDKIDSGNYIGEDGQIDIEILRDLLYQLGSTQPIYTSAMSTTYLNHPWARLCYALSSFTLKRIDWLVQGAKEVNTKHGAVAAGAWVMGVSAFLAMFGAAIGDIGDLLKGKKEETFLWNLINSGIEDALKSGGSDALNSWLKIWDLSDYDIKLYKQQGLWGVLSSKIKPFIFDLGKDITEAITEHDADEITDLAKYVPIFGKLVYYWCWEDLGKETKKSDWGFDMDVDWDFGALTDTWDWEDDEERDFS